MDENGWAPTDAELDRLWAAMSEAGASGSTVTDWRMLHRDVQPGGSTTVAAAVSVARPDGTVAEQTFGASTSSAANAALRLSDGERELGVWRFPHDPALPSLPAACDPERMRGLVAELGLGDAPVALTVRAYRPCRRAVVEIRTPRTTLFAKVVRPAKAEALHRIHRGGGVPVPESLGWTSDGLVVLTGLPGRSLRSHLLGDAADTATLPEPSDIVALLRGLPASFAEAPARRGWAEQARHYANVVATVLPDAAPAAHAIADHVRPVATTPVPVHGDLYESQLLVEHGELSGLLDLDTAHAGDGYDDPACLLAHLAVLARVRPDRAAAIDAYAGRCLREFDRHWDPEALRARVAAVVLSLATGPHRVGIPGWQDEVRGRLDLASHWLAGELSLAA